MSKKDTLLTPEELAAKKIRKSNGWTRFWAIVVALVLVCGVFAVAQTNGKKLSAEIKSEAGSSDSSNSSDSAANADASAGWDSNSSGGDTSADLSGNSGASSDNSGASSDNNGGAASNNNGGAASNNNGGAAASDANSAATVPNAINSATAKAVKAGYDWHRICNIDNVDVGNATDTLNGIIKRVDENASINSVVGNFLGAGDKSETIAKGENAADKIKENYVLKATALKAEDLQNLKVDGNKYTFTLAAASNPAKNNSTPISRLTNDFITLEEVQAGVKDALGGLSFLLSVKSADVEFKNIAVTVTIEDGNLKELHYSYYMDVKSLELSVATGTGYGTVEATYSNFSY